MVFVFNENVLDFENRKFSLDLFQLNVLNEILKKKSKNFSRSFRT